MGCCTNGPNYMYDLVNIITEIVRRQPEPEMCNIRCPPLGCPRGPCPGACSYQGITDPCCISKMPCCAAPPPLPCRVPPMCFLQSFAKEVGYPPDSCLSPPNARLRLLLSVPARKNVQVSTCPPPPCCPSPPGCCITPCCPY